MIRAAFFAKKLSPQPFRLLNGGLLINLNGTIPKMSTLWSRAHSIFYSRTGITAHKVFDSLLRSFPPTREFSIIYAKAAKIFQKTIVSMLRPHVSSLNSYIRRRLDRYSRDGLNCFQPFLRPCGRMIHVNAEERDRSAVLRFFFNGWFTARRFQGRARGNVGRCMFCGHFSGNDLLVPIHAYDEDSNDHARFCPILSLTALFRGFFVFPDRTWWDAWLLNRFGSTRCDGNSSPRPPSSDERHFDSIAWLGALYTLHNVCRNRPGGFMPWRDASEVIQSLLFVLGNNSGKKIRTKSPKRRPDVASSTSGRRRPRVAPRNEDSTGMT